MSTGTVKWFNGGKGYGFITADEGGADLFVDHSEVKTAGYANLDEGQKVDYTVGEGKKGPCATNVISETSCRKLTAKKGLARWGAFHICLVIYQ